MVLMDSYVAADNRELNLRVVQTSRNLSVYLFCKFEKFAIRLSIENKNENNDVTVW
jgi:hypothetical protein